MVSRRLKLMLGIIIPIFGFFLMSQNTFAEAVTTTSLGLLYGDSGGNWQLQRGIYYGFGNGITFNTDMYGRIQDYDWLTPVITLQGSTASIHFETNIVASFFGNLPNYSVYNPWTNLEYLTVKSCGSRTINTQSVSTAVTEWRDTYDGRTRYNYTLTVYGDVSVNGFSANTTDDVRCTVSAGDTFFFNVINTGTGISNNLRVWFEQNPMNFYWSNSIDNSLLQTQINQNNTIINQNQQVIDQNNAAYDSISNQDAGDISGATNSQTSSIIGVISSFVTSLSSINATSCDLSLPFPEFLGGDTVVTPCSGKEKAPALITIGSSMLLIGVFIPLAWIVLRMIYNEIRSWTNG